MCVGGGRCLVPLRNGLPELSKQGSFEVQFKLSKIAVQHFLLKFRTDI